jgi:hypothetical protein
MSFMTCVASFPMKSHSNTPVLCNSLYLEKGSAQPAHVDSIFMTPRTPKIATWFALGDAKDDAGQLYYWGSHRIEQMKFTNGSYHFILKRWRSGTSTAEFARSAFGLPHPRY